MSIFYIFAGIFLITCAIFNLNKILNHVKINRNKHTFLFLNVYAVSVGLYGLWIGFN